MGELLDSSYIIHLKIFILLGGGQSLSTSNAAMIIIEGIRTADEQNLDITNKRTSHKAKARKIDDKSIATNCTRVFVFL